jgi:hypothetical protein
MRATLLGLRRTHTSVEPELSVGVPMETDDYFAEEVVSPTGLQDSPFLLPSGRDRRREETVELCVVVADTLCCGPVGRGPKACGKLRGDCTVGKHRVERDDEGNITKDPRIHLESGVYLRSATGIFPTPYLPHGTYSNSEEVGQYIDTSMSKSAAMGILQEALNASGGPGEEPLATPTGLPPVQSGGAEVMNELSSQGATSPSKKLRIFGPVEEGMFTDPQVQGFASSTAAWCTQARDLAIGLQAQTTKLDSKLGVVPEGHTQLWPAVEQVMATTTQLETSQATHLKTMEALAQKVQADTASAVATAGAANTTAAAAASGTDLRTLAQKVTTVDKREAATATKTRSIEKGFVALLGVVEEMEKGSSSAGGNVGLQPPDSGKLATQMHAFKTGLEEVRQKLVGGGFQTSVGDFSSLAFTLVWAKTHLPSKLIIECFSDIMILLTSIRANVTTRASVQMEEIHESRVRRTGPQSVVVTSFQTTDPELYGATDGVSHYSKLKTFAHWDAGDGLSGVYNDIRNSLTDFEQRVTAMINHALEMHPEGRRLCMELLSLTLEFFRAKSGAMSSLYRQLLVNAFGSETPSKEAKATCWKIVTTLLRVIFKQLRSARVVAESAYTNEDNVNGIYLWGVLQAHRVMKKFIGSGFTGHEEFHPQMIMFLFETMTPRSEVAQLRTLSTTFSGIADTVTTLGRNYDDLARRVRALESAAGAGGGGGGAPGGGAAKAKLKKDRKKKRVAAAAAAAAAAGDDGESDD